jgi:hypothetical protein
MMVDDKPLKAAISFPFESIAALQRNRHLARIVDALAPIIRSS